jgi:hypothetical protein
VLKGVTKQLKHRATCCTRHSPSRGEAIFGREGIHLENTAIEAQLRAPRYPTSLLSIQERSRSQLTPQEGKPAGSCATTPATNAPRATMDADFILNVRSDELMLGEAVS